MIDGLPLGEMLADPSIDPRIGFANHAGQPESVRLEFLAAMGLEPDGTIRDDGTAFLVNAGTAKTRMVWS
jgi:hypothetical protein